MQPRPTAVTVLAIFNIIFGVLGALCTPFSAVGLFLPQPASAPPNPVVEAIKAQPIYFGWNIISLVLGTILAICLLMSGVGLLQMRSWGRTLALGYAFTGMALGAISTLMMMVFVYPRLAGMLDSSDPAALGGAIGGMAGGIGGACCGMIYPIIILVVLHNPVVKAAFEDPYGG